MNYEWLLKVKANLLAAKNIIPEYHTGDDDPKDIQFIKRALYNLQCDADRLLGHLYRIIETTYEKEYGSADRAADLQDAADYRRESREGR